MNNQHLIMIYCGEMSEQETQKAMEITEMDNFFLDQFRGRVKTTQEEIEYAMKNSKYYEDAQSDEITTAAERVYKKLKVINGEYLQWFEVLLAMVFAIIGYAAPIILLKFQAKMRQMEMEDEVMQFQTIILMLMKIERVNVGLKGMQIYLENQLVNVLITMKQALGKH